MAKISSSKTFYEIIKLGEELLITHGDRYQVEQVFLNLYMDAWQAMPGGGDLYVETTPVNINAAETEIYEVQPGQYARISVRDTGIGMGQETQTKIFEPLFTTKEMGQGPGLGLASVYGIVRNHHGPNRGGKRAM